MLSFYQSSVMVSNSQSAHNQGLAEKLTYLHVKDLVDICDFKAEDVLLKDEHLHNKLMSSHRIWGVSAETKYFVNSLTKSKLLDSQCILC